MNDKLKGLSFYHGFLLNFDILTEQQMKRELNHVIPPPPSLAHEHRHIGRSITPQDVIGVGSQTTYNCYLNSESSTLITDNNGYPSTPQRKYMEDLIYENEYLNLAYHIIL